MDVTCLELLVRKTSHAGKTWRFPKLWQPPSEERFWQTRPEQHRSPNTTPARHFLEQPKTQQTWKCKINQKENHAKNERRTLHALETQKPIASPLIEAIWQKGQLWPKRGVIFHVENQCHMQGPPIVLYGHIPDFRSSSEGGIWSCRGLDPVFQEVLWPNG